MLNLLSNISKLLQGINILQLIFHKTFIDSLKVFVNPKQDHIVSVPETGEKYFHRSMDMNRNCSSPYPRFNLQSEHRITLVIYNVLVNGISSLISNTLVIFALVTTKQLKTAGMRLVVFLSVSDLFGACVCIVFFTMLLTEYSDTCYTTIERLSLFFLVFCGHCSSYTIALISFDRYARVKFASNYKVKITGRRVIYMVIGAVTISLVDGILFTFGSIFDFTGVANGIVLTIDTFILICIVVSYSRFNKSIIQSRNKVASMTARGNQSLSNTNEQNLTRTIKMILLSLAIMYALYFLAVTINVVFYKDASVYWKGWLEFFLFLGLYTVHSNALVNAIVFLWTNKKSRNLIKQKFGLNPEEDSSTTEPTVNKTSSSLA